MVVLGLGFTNHEASAALVIDGKVATGIARERLTRVKKDGKAWGTGRLDLGAAVRYCLDAHDLHMRDLDLLVWNHIDHVPAETLFSLLAAEGGMDLSGLQQFSLPHHFAHACGAFYVSPFDEAAVLVADGMGGPLHGLKHHCSGPEPRAIVDGDTIVENLTADGSETAASEQESFYHFGPNQHQTLRKIVGNWHGIGAVYATVSQLLFDDCLNAGKTMGLAPYGKPSPSPLFLRPVSQDGRVSFTSVQPPEREKLESEFRALRGRRNTYDYLAPAPSTLAASVQLEAEEALLTHARWLRDRTSSRNLCLSGGVALNCVANARIALESGFDAIFVPPAPGDDGIALGCALFGAALNGGVKREPCSAFLGRSYSHNADELAALGLLPVARGEQVHDWIAGRLAAGAVVAVFHGGAEVGPRALGHRSFLADPRTAAVRDHLNRVVKKREMFRPFAPAVLEDAVSEYFEESHPSYFMSFVGRVRAEKRAIVPAVTHVDGTARYQVVRQRDNPELHQVIESFARRTGVPMVLNTSLNRAGQPIVETPQEAGRCATDASVDDLVVDGCAYQRSRGRSRFWFRRRK